MSDIKLSSFPDNKFDALTMLYLEKCADLTGLTPEQLAEKYIIAYNEIRQEFKNARSQTKNQYLV